LLLPFLLFLMCHIPLICDWAAVFKNIQHPKTSHQLYIANNNKRHRLVPCREFSWAWAALESWCQAVERDEWSRQLTCSQHLHDSSLHYLPRHSTHTHNAVSTSHLTYYRSFFRDEMATHVLNYNNQNKTQMQVIAKSAHCRSQYMPNAILGTSGHWSSMPITAFGRQGTTSY